MAGKKKPAPKKALEEMSDAELDAAFAASAPQPVSLDELSDDELDRMYAMQHAPGPGALEKTETALRSGFEGATAGISEPVISGVNALLDVATDKIPGLYDVSDDRPITTRLKEAYSKDAERRKGLKKELPGYDIAGQVTGAVLPSPINVGAKIFKGASALAKGLPGISKGLELAETLAPVVGPKIAPTLAQRAGIAAAKIGAGAAEGAMGGAGFEAVRQAAEGTTGFLEHPENAPGEIAQAAKFGGAFGGAVPAVIEGAKAIPAIGKKILSSLGGVKVSDIDAFLANPKALKDVKTPEEIYALVEQKSGEIRQGLEDATLTRDQAERAMDRLESQVREAAKRKRFDLGETVREARSKFNSAVTSKMDELKSVKPPEGLADDITGAVDELKDTLVRESDRATELLSAPENAGKSIRKGDLVKQVDDAIEGLKVEGEAGERVPVSETAELAISRLGKVKERFSKLKEEIPLSQAKEITKQLDKDINFLESAGAFHDDPSNASLAGIRHYLREEAGKLVPEYDRAMKEIVAPLAQLRSEASKRFGKRASVLSKLSRIDSDALQVDREVLDAVGEATGRNFRQPLEQFRAAQAQLTGGGRAAMESALPEAQALAKAEALKTSAMQPGAEAWEVENAMRLSQEAKAMQAAADNERAARAVFDEIRMLTTGKVESRVNSMMRGNDREVRKAFTTLSKLTDTDFEGLIEKARLQKAFSGEFRIGSRNVNLWAILSIAGTVASGGLGLAPLAAAASTGAMIGGLVDRFGPQMTRKVLEFYAGVQGVPTVQKILRSTLPETVKHELIRDLTTFAIVGDRDPSASVIVPADVRRQTRYDIRNAPNLDNNEKAKMLDALNRRGELINSDDLILGGVPKPPPQPLAPRPRPGTGERLRNVADFVREKKPEAY
jgi:hypothetical protein